MADDEAKTMFLVALAEPRARRRKPWESALFERYRVLAVDWNVRGEFEHDTVVLLLAKPTGDDPSIPTLQAEVRVGWVRPRAKRWLNQDVIVGHYNDRYGTTAKILMDGKIYRVEEELRYL